jgi:hypothetical protein
MTIQIISTTIQIILDINSNYLKIIWIIFKIQNYFDKVFNFFLGGKII